jgi:PA14 domain
MLYRITISLLVLLLTACASNKPMVEVLNNMAPTASGEQAIELQMWTGIGGKAVRSLTRNKRFPLEYSSTEGVTELDFIDSKGDKYAQRIRGLIQVEQDGDYRFWLSADESAEVWVSTDSNLANRRLIAFVNKPSGYKIWDRFKTQKSPLLTLAAGKQYYIEILHKENIGGDYLSVAWSGPGFDKETLSTKNISFYDQMANYEETYHMGYHNGYQSGRALLTYNSRYLPLDSDDDGLPDFYENLIGTDATDPTDALEDPDADLLTTLDEYMVLSNPLSADSDGDGMTDGFEVLVGLDVNYKGDALLDNDGDGVTNIDEYNAGTHIDDPNSVPVVEPNTPDTISISLTWQVPDQREDGSDLSASEITGYKIYIGSSANDLSLLTTLNGGAVVSYTATDLPAANYYFAISTLTSDGVESAKSEVLPVAF